MFTQHSVQYQLFKNEMMHVVVNACDVKLDIIVFACAKLMQITDRHLGHYRKLNVALQTQ